MNLKEIIKSQIKKSFVKEYQDKTTDEEALGIAISHYFKWDGLAILKTLYNALEDANFHTDNEVIQGLIDKYEKAAIT